MNLSSWRESLRLSLEQKEQREREKQLHTPSWCGWVCLEHGINIPRAVVELCGLFNKPTLRYLYSHRTSDAQCALSSPAELPGPRHCLSCSHCCILHFLYLRLSQGRASLGVPLFRERFSLFRERFSPFRESFFFLLGKGSLDSLILPTQSVPLSGNNFGFVYGWRGEC